MHHALRPYATAGVALVGASIIAVTPMVAESPSVQMRPVKLVDAWSDLISDTTTNLQSILTHADTAGIANVFSALLTNPTGVLEAFTNLDPTVATSGTDITVTLPPGLEVLIAQFGAEAAEFEALNGVLAQLSADPSNALSILYEGTASILNAGLNGADNVSLLNGIINIPLFNGILAPTQTMSVDLNLTDLINALGLGNLSLSNLDLSSLLSQIGLGDLTLGGLFSDLGISGDGLGTLLGNPDLSTLLGDLGLGGLGLGSFSLTDILKDLGLDSTLGQLSLTQVLDSLNLNPDLGNISLANLIGDLFPGLNVGGVQLGTLLNDLGLITPLAGDLNSALSTLLGPEATALNAVLHLISPSLNVTNLISSANLETVLNNLTLGNGSPLDLTTLLNDLGIGSNTTALGTISELLGTLGITVPSTGSLSVSSLITDVLTELGKAVPSTGNISLDTLLSDLSIGSLDVGALLNNVSLGDLLGDLGLSNLPLDLSNLGDLSNLTLDGLLGDLGLGDIASINVDTFGGLATLLAETIPQQILNAI